MSENVDIDLFGHASSRQYRGRGRPPHDWNREYSEKVMLNLARGWSIERIARALNISKPTLRKVYFSELRERDIARDRVETLALHTMLTQGVAGNAAMLKEFMRRFDADIAERFPQQVAEAAEKLGKKERLQRESENPPAGWAELVPTIN